MTRRKTPIAVSAAIAASDADDARPPLPPTDSVSRVLYLLEYARRRGFRIGPTLVVGDVTLQVEDVRFDAREGRDVDDGSEPDVYAMAGVAEEPAEGTAG